MLMVELIPYAAAAVRDDELRVQPPTLGASGANVLVVFGYPAANPLLGFLIASDLPSASTV